MKLSVKLHNDPLTGVTLPEVKDNGSLSPCGTDQTVVYRLKRENSISVFKGTEITVICICTVYGIITVKSGIYAKSNNSLFTSSGHA